MPTPFDDIEIGQVISLGAAIVDGAVLRALSPPSIRSGRWTRGRPTP